MSADVSPAPLISFAGTDFSASRVAFPDPTIAVSPSHVVTAVNARVQWYDRNGALQHDEQLVSFLNAGTPLIGDPRVVYDDVNGRFVLSADVFGANQVHLAVSRDSDPNNGWHFAALNTGRTIDGEATWADFPVISTDGDAVYLTASMKTIGPDGVIFSADDVFKETRLWIIDDGAGAGGLYDGGPVQMADFGADVVTGGTGTFFGRPTQMLSPTSGSLGTFLVHAGGGAVFVTRIDDPTTAPQFQTQVLLGTPSGSFANSASQPGTSATLSAQAFGNAVWVNGLLYTVGAVGPTSGPDAGIQTAHWYVIDTSNPNALRIVDEGDVSGSAIGAGSGVATFAPTIMANGNGDFLVNFAASGPNLFPGAYYALHAAGDAAGTIRSPLPLHAGLDSFELTFGGRIRWGDYSGIALDPTDRTTFWLFNEYAAVRGPGQAGNWATQIGAVSAVQALSLIDPAFYFSTYPDVALAGLDAAFHYNTFGWKEGRDPNALFDTTAYLSANADIRTAGLNPLTHYDQHGWKEGRDPGPNFDNEYYLSRAPDVAAAGLNPLLHYLNWGEAEGREIGPAIGSGWVTGDGFDPQYYLMTNPDVAAAGIDPYRHYFATGWKEWRDPSAFFSTGGYLAANLDVNAAGLNPLVHYDQHGWREGRDPSALFDTGAYLSQNPDVAAAGVNPLVHYLRFGVKEGRAVQPAVGPASRIAGDGFDPVYYALAYPSVVASGADPYTDFTTIGWQPGRDPNGLFDTDYCLSHNADVAAAGVNPLTHYSQHGWTEGCDPSVSVGTSAYLAANPDFFPAGGF